MKHLLNNLTEQEKNSIREQHTGGMKVSNYRFKELLENKLGNDKPLVEQFDDEDDYDFGFESPSCPSCKGNGCEECDGSGMKRNSVVNNDDDEELYRGAPERLVKHMDSGKIVGTHKHGVGYTPNKHGIRLGHSSHPTSIPNFTKFDDEDDFEDDTYSINEQVPVSGSTGPVPSSTSTPLSVSGPTRASSTVRENVVKDCIEQIYYVMIDDKKTWFDKAKTTTFNEDGDGRGALFLNGEIPTEKEWTKAQEKFILIILKGVFNIK